MLYLIGSAIIGAWVGTENRNVMAGLGTFGIFLVVLSAVLAMTSACSSPA